MRKLDSVRMIMLNHSSDQFAFLKGPGGKANRALYYNALSKILFAEDCSIKQFLDFMKPFQIQLENLLSLNSVEDFRQESVKVSILKRERHMTNQLLTSLLFFHRQRHRDCSKIFKAL